MKLSAYMTLTMMIAFSAVQAADAQDARGARFNYAPNIWKAEHGVIPKDYGNYVEPAHNVKAGSMPARNLLGLDPIMLSKPAAAPPVPTTQVTAQAQAPRTNAAFSRAFGNPASAQMPVPPLAAAARPYTPVKPAIAAPAQAAQKPVVVASRSVRGRNYTPARHVPASESSTSHIASYDSGFGYSPSPGLLPSSGGGSATTKVSGKIIRHSHT